MAKTKNVAEIFKALGAAHSQLQACFKSRGDDFADAATAHGAAADACAMGAEASKAQDDFFAKLEKSLVPDSISSVHFSDVPPEGFAFGINARAPRLIARNGQRQEELSKTLAGVDPMFRHLISD
jgi:hypothetical protein